MNTLALIDSIRLIRYFFEKIRAKPGYINEKYYLVIKKKDDIFKIPVLPVFFQKNTELIISNKLKQAYSLMRANQSRRINQGELFRANQSRRIN